MIASALDQLVTTLAAQTPPVTDPAQILAAAHADPRTVNSIPGGSLRVYMTATGIGPRLTRSAATIAGTGQVAASDQLTAFVAYAMSGADFDSTNATYAAQVQALAAPLIGMFGQSSGTLGLSQAEVNALIALGGGYLLMDATADDVTAAVARVAAQAAQAIRFAAISVLRLANNGRYNANAAKLDAMVVDATKAIPADLPSLDAAGGG